MDAMPQILKYGDNYRSMTKMKAEIERGVTEPEPAPQRRYPRFCGSVVKKYRDVIALLRQIKVPQLQTLLARHLNLSEGVVHRCRI